ncbi:rhomboid family intramembrane serine protease [Myxococcus sp. CA033]|uniref:rhomboid family intramembrane serine protease n=1 Tax=unclassified Myxococcus TaxID=2648731 RepID=UPI00157AA476|nr:rhomboid family intramembrane serine protease [Myxococcus sp. CA033]NTX56506.1 rhomboid family intramembrane serine protease [Myxococcus sp. CA039A]
MSPPPSTQSASEEALTGQVPAPPAAVTSGPPFAEYLARRLMADKGFQPGTHTEAAELVDVSDAVLTYSDGYSCVIVCIVDREREPSRRFSLETSALERVGKACLHYSGTVSGTKLPVGLQLIEVGSGPATREDQERLERHRLGMFNKVHLHAMHVDVSSGEVWANTWRRAMVSRGYVRGLLREPRVVEGQEVEVAEAVERKPVLTVALLVALALGFAAEHLFAVGSPGTGLLAPGLQTLVGLGGLVSGLVLEHGQWWRLFLAPLLHGDLIHLLLNGFCLWFGAMVLESMVGRAWLGVLLVVSALGGGALSMALNGDAVVSVGASGALMGLLAAVLAVSRRLPVGPGRVEVQMMALRLLVPSLIPIAVSRTGNQVDFAAHVGGALAGGVVGLGLARVWRREDATPPGTRWAGAVSLLALGAVVVSLVFAAGFREDLASMHWP